MKKCLFSKRCWALRCDHCLHTKRKWTSEELHSLGSKLPKRAGELPINHAGASRRGSAGRTAMLWEEQGRCHGPLCQCDWSQTPLAAFLCESLLSSAYFTFSYCSPIYKIPASGLSQPILLSEEGKFTQTDLLTISWPAKCQTNIWNSGGGGRQCCISACAVSLWIQGMAMHYSPYLHLLLVGAGMEETDRWY